MRVFEVLEKYPENAGFIFCSVFQNLRLGSINLPTRIAAKHMNGDVRTELIIGPTGGFDDAIVGSVLQRLVQLVEQMEDGLASCEVQRRN